MDCARPIGCRFEPASVGGTSPDRTPTGWRVMPRSAGHVGMTLVEIMVVIALMAVLVSGVALGVNAVPRTRLRASAVRLSSTFRFAYVHALTTGRTTRVGFRLGSSQLVVEDTNDAHTLDRNDPLRAGGAADVEQRARR